MEGVSLDFVPAGLLDVYTALAVTYPFLSSSGEDVVCFLEVYFAKLGDVLQVVVEQFLDACGRVFVFH